MSTNYSGGGGGTDADADAGAAASVVSAAVEKPHYYSSAAVVTPAQYPWSVLITDASTHESVNNSGYGVHYPSCYYCQLFAVGKNPAGWELMP